VTPSPEEHNEFWRKLHDVITWALHELKDQEGEEVARAVAEQLDRREFRIRTRCDLDAHDEPQVDSLWYRVEVRIADDWLELVEARWPALGVSEEHAREEIRMTMLQNGIGIPDDASSITDPPSDDPSEA
jgi:hypothetical protein